jgi:hypothetical protein
VKYPPGFPPQFRGAVERAFIKAERELHRTLAALPPGGTRDAWDIRRSRSANAVVTLVYDVIPSFTDGACEAIRQGNWSLQQGREAIDEWLKDVLVPHAYTLAHLKIYVMESDFEPFRETLVARVQESDGWGACLDALLAVADEASVAGTDAQRQEGADPIATAPWFPLRYRPRKTPTRS